MAGSSAAATCPTKSTVIVLDSSDEDECTADSANSTAGSKPSSVSSPPPPPPPSKPQIEVRKRPLPTSSSTPRRIKPTLLSSTVSVKRTKFNDDQCVVSDTFPDESIGDCAIYEPSSSPSAANSSSPSTSTTTTTTTTVLRPATPINEAFATLIEACRSADNTTDMELLISKKLTRYYQTVHPDFVNSKSFVKTVLSVAAEIVAQPSLVYLKVSSILDELSIRRKSGQTVVVVASDEAAAATAESSSSTGDAKKDFQIKRLNQALYVLKKKIAKLDEADVDLDDDDNSTYLLVERYKKRACEIYEKICDITGESKSAYRQVRKPIVFQGTNYPLFNKTITSFVNRTHVFPDLFDVLRCLEHCNSQYEFKLSKEEVKRIAQDAFIKIGKSLQKRRKTDLYETVSYYTGNEADPANEDPQLQRKLADNEKYHSRINELIDRYASEQYSPSSSETSKKALTKTATETTSHINNNTIAQTTSNSIPTSTCLAGETLSSTPTTTVAPDDPNVSATSTTSSTVFFDNFEDPELDPLQFSPTTYHQPPSTTSPSLTSCAADVISVSIASPLLATANGFDAENIILSDDEEIL